MSGGYRGRGLSQTEVSANTADFRNGGGVVDQSAALRRISNPEGQWRDI